MSAQHQDNTNHILDHPPRKLRGEITIIQHNTAKTEGVHQTLLEIAARRKADIIAIQEPKAWQNKTTNLFYSISHNMYELILPTNLHIRPRVAIYLRKATNFQFKTRQDLAENSDFLAIEIYKPTERFLLFNLYNEKELSEDSGAQSRGKTTVKRSVLGLNPRLPFLLLGDFNSHHPWWNSEAGNPPKETQDLVAWLQHHNCELLGEEEPTLFRSNLINQSIIDLAFHSPDFKETQIDNWATIESTGSDHVTIGFSLFLSLIHI